MSINSSDHHSLYQDYLLQKHSQFNTPESVIDEEVKKATQSHVATKDRLILGEANEVYNVTTDDGQQVIVRISRSEHPRFEAEKLAIDMARKAGVPVPEVLLVEEVQTNSENLAFSIEKKIDGVALEDLVERLKDHQDSLKCMIIEAGEVLSKLHSVIVSNFGGLYKKDDDKYKNWSEFIYIVEKKQKRIIDAATNMGVDTSLIDQALQIIRSNGDLYQNVKPHLLHGDFSLKHFLVKDGHIVGIIDFEDCKGGDPVYDFAWFNYFYEDVPLEWIKKGYKDREVLENNFNKKLQIYRLHLGLRLIDYYESENNRSGINDTKRKFLNDLKLNT